MGVSHSHEDTIVAIASPHGSGVRGIVRLSGTDAIKFAAVDFQTAAGSPELESLSTADTINGSFVCDGVTIPGTLLAWPGESSFTRQPSVEFHTFGSTPVLELIVKQLCCCGARMAEPGEFTMRAFLSGRLDLTQAEAVLAVIDAKNRKQLDVAIDQLAGGMGARLNETRNELVAALAELEAGLDFVEEDIEFITNDAMIEKMESACRSIDRLMSHLSKRDSQNANFRVSLFGLPNAGKSSLFNRLARKDLAIVSDVQGTTTDRVSTVCEIGSQRVELIDTAGLETVESNQSIAAASQVQRQNEIEQCDLALLCINATDSLSEIETQIQQLSEFRTTKATVVLTQTDRLDSAELEQRANEVALVSDELIMLANSVDDSGADELRALIARQAIESQSSESAIVGSTMLRTGESLSDARAAIDSALSAARLGIGDEVVASEVRSALDCIGLIVGTIYTDDILDVVFGKFCIGK